MKDKHCHIIAEAANFIMVYIACLSSLMFAELLMKRGQGMIFFGVLLGILAVCYFSRVLISNFLLFAGLHLVFYIPLFFVPATEGKVELLVFYTFFVFLDLGYWMKKRQGGFAPVHIALVFVNALAYFYCSVKQNRVAMVFFFVLGVLYFLLYYVRLFFSNVSNLAREKASDERMPYSDMFWNGFKIAFPFVGLSILAMILAKVDFLDRYVIMVYEFCVTWIGRILRYALYVIHWLASLMITSRSDENMGSSFVGMEGTKEGIILKIISSFIYFASLSVLVFLAVKGIIALIGLIPMHRKLMPQVIEESDMVEIRERIVKSERKKSEKLNKVRKRYKKTIEKQAKSGYVIEKNHTPRERAGDLEQKRGVDISELSREYEGARYQDAES